jgi:hypothetical protein
VRWTKPGVLRRFWETQAEWAVRFETRRFRIVGALARSRNASATISGALVSHQVNEMHTERMGDAMETEKMSSTTGVSLRVLDECGRLVGTIQYPVVRDPLGVGRETVYLARIDQPDARPAAAA